MAEHGASNGSYGQRYVVISADGHSNPPDAPHRYRDYLEGKHVEIFDHWLENGTGFAVRSKGQFSDPERPYRGFFASFGMPTEWSEEVMDRYFTEPPPILDPVARCAEVASKGVVAELMLDASPLLGFSGVDDADFKRELGLAHLRWLIDYTGAVPGRIAAGIDVDYSDLERAMADIRWARESGLFGGVMAPSAFSLIASGTNNTPSLVDPHWEPLWSLCEELELPLIVHGGLAPDAMTAYGADPNLWRAFMYMEAPYFSLRSTLFLILAGVFDRHPKLRIGHIEQQVGIIPGVLHDWDQMIQSWGLVPTRASLSKLPSEYWYEHAFVGASFIDDTDAREHRYEIGVPNMMWGGDYPHPEGSWPYFVPAIKYGLGGVPEPELRDILGGNAARVFGFDLPMLQRLADEHGPTVDDLSTPLAHADLPPYATAYAFNRDRVGEPAGVTG
jgi:predicted TIM-barrel fold metal-dependent hydrolase